MKDITAKYDGQCRACGDMFSAGDRIKWGGAAGGGTHTYHPGCAPTGPSGTFTKDDLEYQKGVADVQRFRENRALFGDEAAEAMEIEREIREGWDY